MTELDTKRPAAAAGSLRPGLVVAIVGGAQFMVILDLAIVILAIPSIQEDLSLGPSQPQWVLTTYGLTLGGFLLLGGRTADLYGRRNALVAGLGMFTAGSLTAGLAWGFVPLVASRGVQGLGAALAAPAALSTVTNTFEQGAPRNRALGIFGAFGAAAASIGNVLGGVVTTGPGWEWVFLMNVPIGAGLVALAWRYLPRDVRRDQGSLDLLGAASVTAGLLAIVYAISRSPEHGWTSGATVGALAVGSGLLASFVLAERRTRAPILPLSVIHQRTLTRASLVAALFFASFVGFNLQISVFMQDQLGYSALTTGMAWLPTSIGAVAVMVAVAARAVGRFGAAHTLAAAQTTAVAGLVLLARAPNDAAYWTDLFPGLLLIGVAIGFAGTAVQAAAFIGTAEDVAGVAGGIIESSREIGGALGTAVIATVVAGSDMQAGALVAAALSATAALLAATLMHRAESPPSRLLNRLR